MEPSPRAPVFLRRAQADDHAAITAIIRRAGINPTGLHWARFIIAESGGRVVGTGQIKPHGDGSRELASIAVVPERQGEGIARVIIGALLAGAPPPVYLTCANHLEGFYRRFGFRTLGRPEMPPSLRRIHRVANAVLPRLRPGVSLLVMAWDGPGA